MLRSHILPLLWRQGEIFYFAVWSIPNNLTQILLSGIYPTIREFDVPSVILESTNMFIPS